VGEVVSNNSNVDETKTLLLKKVKREAVPNKKVDETKNCFVKKVLSFR